jgi:multiple sugar transport system permease protein
MADERDIDTLPAEPESAPHTAAAARLARGEDPAAGTRLTVPKRTGGERATTALVYFLLILIALLFFTPLFWSVSTSLKSLPESVKGFDLIPDDPSLRAYKEALTTFNFARYAANSAIVATVVTLTNLVLASIGGYAFARLRFPGREVLFMVVLATLMIPDQLRLIPVFTLLSDFPHTVWNPNFPSVHWNLLGTYQGYVLVGGGGLVAATNLFLMRQYFLTIPKDFEEAAKLDAAGYFKTFLRVMLPLAGPAIAAVTILTFQGTWNDFFWQLIILGQSEDKATLPVGIATFVGVYKTQWPELMAASVIAILPIAVIYIIFQRYFIAGVTAAGVKG